MESDSAKDGLSPISNIGSEVSDQFHHGRIPHVDVKDAPQVPLAPLCACCQRIFSDERHEIWGSYELAQSDAQFRHSVECRTCRLCFLRWTQLSEIERQGHFDNMRFSLIPYGSDNSIGIMFHYYGPVTDPRPIDDKTVVLVPIEVQDTETDSVDSARAQLPLNEQIESTGSQACLARASSWYRDCVENHAKCLRDAQASLFLPTRLIHLGDTTELVPKLVESKDLDSEVEYMTLSHCWGQHRTTCLTRANFAEMKRIVLPSAISETFQQAMAITRKLGVSYLWLDSLCIMQDDRHDWETESLAMSSVYRNAVCNIAATAAKDGRAGCFSTRYKSLVAPCKVNLAWSGLTWASYYVVDKEFWTRSIDDTPLGKRAWVVQERFLAQRVIHFAQQQLFWECISQKACETFPETIPGVLEKKGLSRSAGLALSEIDDVILLRRGLRLPNISVDFALGIWAATVAEYTRGNLTEEKDKLVAIAGLAKALAPSLGHRYFAGLWELRFTLQLIWKLGRSSMSTPPVRSNTYRAPTWSWASMDGEVELAMLDPGYFGFRERENAFVPLRIVRVDVIAVVNDPMGQVRSGYLRVEGYLAKARVEQNAMVKELLQLIRLDSDRKIVRVFEQDVDALRPGQYVYCLPVDAGNTYVDGLVLQPIRRDGESMGICFERVGMFRTYDISVGSKDADAALQDCDNFWASCMAFEQQQSPDDEYHIPSSGRDEYGFSLYTCTIV